MPSIIVLDKLSPDGLALLDAAGRLGISYEVKTGLSGEELKNVLASHDGAICRSGVKITADVLAGNHRLRAIVRAGVGTDNIDKAYAAKKDIIVEGNVIGDVVGTLNGTLIGDVCAGLIKVTVQLICDIDSSVEFVVTADDMITQIRLEAAPTVPPYAGFIQSGSEGQLKIINLVAPAVVGVVEIDLGNGLILELGPDPENGTPVSAQLYYIGGSWQVFQTQNATVS